MEFGFALSYLKAGKPLCRTLWNDEGRHIIYGEDRIYLFYKGVKSGNWQPSCDDMMAEDWELWEDKKKNWFTIEVPVELAVKHFDPQKPVTMEWKSEHQLKMGGQFGMLGCFTTNTGIEIYLVTNPNIKEPRMKLYDRETLTKLDAAHPDAIQFLLKPMRDAEKNHTGIPFPDVIKALRKWEEAGKRGS